MWNSTFRERAREEAAAKGVNELRKILNLSFALALVAGLFAGSLASVGATSSPLSPTYGPEQPGSPIIFFPFVHNGTRCEWDDVHRIGDDPEPRSLPGQRRTVKAYGGNTVNALLNPRASKTFSANDDWGFQARGRRGRPGSLDIGRNRSDDRPEHVSVGDTDDVR